MNRIFKTIRNPITGIVTAASELAKGTSISSRNIGKRNFLALLTAALLSTCVFAETHEFEITDGSAGWSFTPIDTATNTPLVNDVKITIDIQADQDSPYIIWGSAANDSDAISFENNSITASIDNIDGYSAPSILGVMKNYVDTEAADFNFNNNSLTVHQGAYENLIGTAISTNDWDKQLNPHTATFNNNRLYIGEGVRVDEATLIRAENLHTLSTMNNSLTVEGAETIKVTGVYTDNVADANITKNDFGVKNGTVINHFQGMEVRDTSMARVEDNHFLINDSTIELFQGVNLYNVDNAHLNNNHFVIENSEIALFQAITTLSDDSNREEGLHLIDSNLITIKNSDLKGFSGISSNGGLSSHTISNNHIHIEDSMIRGQYVDLGWNVLEIAPAVAIRATSMTKLNVEGNTIYVKNSKLGFTTNEQEAYHYLPFNAISVLSAGATIQKNTIDINNTILSNITGIKFEGHPESMIKDQNQSININHNSVMINGGKGTANIIGIEEMHLPVSQWDDETERFKSYAISSVSNNNTIILNNVDIDAQEIVGIKKTAMDHYSDQNNVDLTTNNNIVLINGAHIRAEDSVTGISTIAEYQSWNESRPDLFSHLTLNATYNTLSITDSEIEGDIRGTQLALGTSSPWGQPLMSGNKIDADNSHNTLNLIGGTFQGNIYGVYLTANNNRDVAEANINATHNTVNLSGDLTLSKDHRMYGAYKDDYLTTQGFSTINYDLFTGNTLNFSANNALTLNEIGGFEFYNFILDPNIKDPYITANTINLESEDLIYQEGSIQSKNAAVNVTGIKGGRELQNGEEFILMSANQNLIGEHGATQTTTIKQGISLEYDVTTNVDTEGKQVIATIGKNPPLTPLEPSTPIIPLTPLEPATPTIPSGPRVNAQLKSLNEGFLAGAMLVNRTQDMITHQVLNEIESNDSQGFGTFGTMMGGYHRYNSGSHVKSKDFMMAVGLSYQVDALTLAAFAESSWSDYDTYNDFKDKTSVHGDGDTRAYGLGLIAKYEWDNGVYIDGSMSMGKLRNTFETKDLQDAGTGEFARYTLKTNYRSAHIGIGYQFSLNELNRLDISGKYLWSHIQGQDITVANDPIHFDSMTSKRVRVNATLTHDYSKTIQLNAGIGYEYEFGGEATGTTYGRYAIEAPSVKGSTGIISIGMSVKPEFNRRLEFNIKGEGSFGKRRGASLSIGGKYEF